jgi:ElaB/YqjD/DUF883 family membrane-anchored ribosome-binding protein
MANTTIEPIRESPIYTTPHNADDPQMIRAQIERTRAQMGHTLDEIQVRLSPEYIKQQAQDTIREATLEKVEEMTQRAERKVNSWRSSAMQTVKENPIPTALIGVGIGWLFLSSKNDNDDNYNDRYYDYSRTSDYDTNRGRRGQTSYRGGAYYGESEESGPLTDAQRWAGETKDQVQRKTEDVVVNVQDQAEALRDNVSEAATHAQERVTETAEQAREKAMQARMQTQQAAEDFQRQAQIKARQVKRTFWQTLEENPLAIGAAAGVAGALVGLALPITEKENELMGETRDHLMEEASATVQDTARKAQNVAERAVQTATDEAKREAEQQDLTMPSSVMASKNKPEGTPTRQTNVSA